MQCKIEKPDVILIGEPSQITINCTNNGDTVGYYPFVDLMIRGNSTDEFGQGIGTGLKVVNVTVAGQQNPFIVVS